MSEKNKKTESPLGAYGSLGRILVTGNETLLYNHLRKILVEGNVFEAEGDKTEESKKEKADPLPQETNFSIEHAPCGEAAITRFQAAAEAGHPFAIAFIDLQTPLDPEILEFALNLQNADAFVQIVFCIAATADSWEQISKCCKETDRVLILQNPPDALEVLQLVHHLHKKRALDIQTHYKLKQTEERILLRTKALRAANQRLKDEISGRERIEMELRLAQKLEAVGQLAAGIAHEINTPIQFIGDNVHFLKTSFDDYLGLISKYQDACKLLSEVQQHQALFEEIKEEEELADLEFLQERVPRAFERAFEGLERVTTIVQAMKEFSHPDQREKVPTDLNKSLSNTLTVATNEYKYVAEIETDFGDIPLVTCLGGDVNQVFLNLIVNAAHAIADVVKDPDEKGKIWIKTEQENDQTVLITIRDSGSGIPEDIRQRVFDPFFTTKGVGKGTGQGLAIARSVIVDKHDGTMSLESAVGQGTTFFIRLPINGNIHSKEEAA